MALLIQSGLCSLHTRKGYRIAEKNLIYVENIIITHDHNQFICIVKVIKLITIAFT